MNQTLTIDFNLYPELNLEEMIQSGLGGTPGTISGNISFESDADNANSRSISKMNPADPTTTEILVYTLESDTSLFGENFEAGDYALLVYPAPDDDKGDLFEIEVDDISGNWVAVSHLEGDVPVNIINNSN